MSTMLAELGSRCATAGIAAPSRATVYHYMSRAPARSVPTSDLPASARTALYNLPATVAVPGHQLVFYCFNYGDLAAISYAAGRPWLDIYQALRVRGWRQKSRGLLESVARTRGI